MLANGVPDELPETTCRNQESLAQAADASGASSQKCKEPASQQMPQKRQKRNRRRLAQREEQIRKIKEEALADVRDRLHLSHRLEHIMAERLGIQPCP